MASKVLENLLKEYDQKRSNAEFDLDKRKSDLYKKYPKLEEIEDQINKISISTTQNILKKGNSEKEQIEFKNKIHNLELEKKKLLDSYNISEDYLKPNYSCKICNDTGYVTDENGNTVMCNCLKQKLLECSFEESNMSNLDKENFSTFNLNIFSDKVDVDKYHFEISPRENMLNIKNKCEEFIENFDDPSQKNLLFTGNTGLR